MRTLKDCCTLLTDGDWIESKDQSLQGIRLIQTGNVGSGEYLEKEKRAKYISAETFARLGCTEVFPGDILISRLPDPVGRACMIPPKTERMITAVDCSILRVDESVIDKRYLLCFLQSPNYYSQLTGNLAGTTRVRISRKNLEKVSLSIPARKKQSLIVNNLSLVSSIIGKRRQQLSALDDLIKARFVEMFGDPDKYPHEPLDNNVCEMFIGPFGSALKNECFVNPEDGYCIVYEQKHAIQKTMNVPTRYVDEKKYNELKRFTVYPGDIIVSCRGTIGEIFIIPDGAPLGIMHPSIMKIRLNTEKYDQKFFVLTLEQYMEEHNNEAKGSGVKMAVTATTLGKELFVVPPIVVQKQFSAFVEQVDKSKAAVQKALDEAQLLFDSLMQEYFG